MSIIAFGTMILQALMTLIRLHSPVVVESSGSYYFIKSDSGSSPYYLAADASGANVYWTQSNDTSAYKKWIIS